MKADGKRPAPDAEQLLQLKRHDLGAIGKELLDRRSYVLGLRQSELFLRHMHDDLNGLSRGSSLAQLTMNSSASLSRSFSRNG